MSDAAEQLCLFDLDMKSGKMCPEHSPPQGEKISGRCLKKPYELRTADFQFLDLSAGGGNMLGACWETNSPPLGEYWTLNTGPAPHNGGGVSTLSQILQDKVLPKYYLSKAACLGILRRAEVRGKELPETLRSALRIQAGLTNDDPKTADTAYPIIAAGFSAGSGSSAGSIAYGEELAPTLKGSAGGNMMPTVLCLNDQGGERMDLSEDICGTLRAAERGHQPLLFENHGIDARYTGPHTVAPTMSARYGTGGNNLPLVAQEAETFCIAGNIIDRESQNGGNGFGYQADLAYTLTAMDHHAVFSRQRVDVFKDDVIASTESARQHKDATDLVCQALTDEGKKLSAYLIRRLTPLECERLQGYFDGWTDIPGASDSARYKALGNSVAVPCVEYVMRGIAYFLQKGA